jgi:RNA polymerase sigma factor (sigma-70 family)
VQKPPEGLSTHLALVEKYAKRYLWCGAPYDELYNVGWIALAKGVRGFDPDKFKNGLTAYAIHWIDGDLRRFVSRKRTNVTGRRTEKGKHLPHTASIDYFGNVAIGDSTIYPDVSLDEDVEVDTEGDDDEVGGCPLDNQVDHRLEGIRGDSFWERRTRYLDDRERHIIFARLDGTTLEKIGLDLGLSAERVRQIEIGAIKAMRGSHRLAEIDEYEWRRRSTGRGSVDPYTAPSTGNLGHDAGLFLRELEIYCKVGIGYFYRSRLQPKCRRPLLPYHEPKLVKITVFGGEYYQRQWDRLRSYEQAGRAPYASPEERAKGQDDWADWHKWKRSPSQRWRLEARRALKAQWALLFWSDDNLSEYEIWSEPNYSRVIYAKMPRYPERLPWLMAHYDFYIPKNGTLNNNGTHAKLFGHGWLVALSIGRGVA